MIRLRLILLALCLAASWLLPARQAGAADGMTALGSAELQKVFGSLAAGRASLPANDLEVTNFSATPAALELPPGAVDFRIISQSQAKQVGQQTIVAEALVDGVAQGRIKLSGDLALYGSVVCAAQSLARHRLITVQDVQRVRRNLTMLGPDLITDEDSAIGKELTTTLQPGAVLYGRFLRDPDLVKRGDIVSILAANEFITVTVPGRVQSAGSMGALVKVKNMMSRKEVFAKVVGPGTVQAQF